MSFAFRRGAFSTDAASGTTVTVALTAVNAGDLIIAEVGYLDTAGTTTVTSVTDTAGNTYTVTAPKARNATQQYAIYQFEAYNVAAYAANTLTFNLSAAATFRQAAAEEWRSTNGAFVTDPFDKTANATGNSAALSSGSVLPSTNNQLIKGWGGAGSGVISASGVFFLREPSGGGESVGSVDFIQTTASSVAATAATSASSQWVMQVSTFKDVGAVATVPAATTTTAVGGGDSSGRARALLMGGDEITDDMLLRPPRLGERTASVVINDFWWPVGTPPAPAQIPLCWLRTPITLRLERPFNNAEVSQVGGGTARAVNRTSIGLANGVFPFTASLHTAVDADPANLADFTVTYYDTPRMRCPLIVMDLLYRTDDEKRYLLDIGIGRRIQITDVPPEWPEGADHLIVVGIGHELTTTRRILRFTTSPVIGSVPGTAGPWFRWGSSVWTGSDLRPF